MKNFQPNFSHIYIEDKARDYPLSKLAIEKFSKSTIIQISHYKDVFNRPNQDFQIQKSSMKLILAKKTAPFLYPASEMVQEFGSPNNILIRVEQQSGGEKSQQNVVNIVKTELNSSLNSDVNF